MVSFSVDPGPFSAVTKTTGGGHLPTSIFLAMFGLSPSLKLILSGHPILDTHPQSLTPAFVISAN